MYLSFAGKLLDIDNNPDETAEDYELTSGSTLVYLMRLSGGAKYTNERCIISYADSPDDPRMELPCGHAITKDSLLKYIDTQVKKHKTDLKCPETSCSQVWDISKIKDMAMNHTERKSMEVGLAENLIFDKFECKECPKCGCLITRTDSGFRVKCLMCYKDGTTFVFCWCCSGEWKRPGSGYKICGNLKCDPDKSTFVQLLATCNTTKMKYSEVVVPAIRACPKCGEGINHKEGCKHMLCPTCDTEFCFVCLGIRNKATGAWPNACGGYSTSCKVAPRQTTVPSRHH